MWEPQLEDSIHQHLGVTREVQALRVIQDQVVRVGVQQHGDIAPSNTDLHGNTYTSTFTTVT